MSEQELNSYRFVSGLEPSDEMLTQIMREAAHDAKERHERATADYFERMRHNIEEKKVKWSARINAALNG